MFSNDLSLRPIASSGRSGYVLFVKFAFAFGLYFYCCWCQASGTCHIFLNSNVEQDRAMFVPFPELLQQNEASIPEDMKKKLDTIGAKEYRAIANLVYQLQWIRLEAVETSILQSGLSFAQISQMRAASKSLIGVAELLKEPILEGGYALGLDSYNGLYIIRMIAEIMNLKSFWKSYDEFELNPAGNTYPFMQKLVETERPIFMFIPDNFLNHPRAEMTKTEFLWLMENPLRMRNVTFVFGAYDLFSVASYRDYIEMQYATSLDSIDEFFFLSLKRLRASLRPD